MRWPWISVRVLDEAHARLNEAQGRIEELREERDWLREQNEKLQKEFVRVERKKAGLPEDHRQPREPIGKMPERLREYVNGFASQSIRRQEREAIFRRRVERGESWQSIMDDVLEHQEETVGQA